MATEVVIIGVGLVGSEFISQLLGLQNSPFKITALTSSKKLLRTPSGFSATSNWKQELAEKGTPLDVHNLLQSLTVKSKGGKKIVVVDNTSSDDVAALYPGILKAGMHVITPNKKAFSSSLQLYKEIRSSSIETGAKFLNESTVGAGLPIISTLKDLVQTGDKVYKIEGVFSGTMSYIFNNFSTADGKGPSFSDVVKTAREKGYTEPHPADDLNGADVARKLTILSRMVPALLDLLPEGYKSVDTKSLVPAELERIASGDEFCTKLPEHDQKYQTLREGALQEKKVLRYVGVIDVGAKTIKASLEKYPVDHPFATSLGGSDNIIMFHTERYGARPLIVQGAGAGAAVTAMGIMSDLLKLL